MVIAQQGTLRLRFVWDRADFFVDIGSNKEAGKWVELFRVLDELRAQRLLHEEYKHSNKLNVVRSLLRKHIGLLKSYAASEVTVTP